MKYLTSLFIAIMTISAAVFAAPLSPEDAKLLQSRVQKVGTAFDHGDIDLIVEMTHPSLFKLVGGKEKMIDITRAAMAQIKSLGVEIVETKLGTPTEVHVAADELVCFYPRATVMRIGEKKAKATGFFICVRKIKGGEWLFLDSSGLEEDPEILQKLLPALTADLALPENRVELL